MLKCLFTINGSEDDKDSRNLKSGVIELLLLISSISLKDNSFINIANCNSYLISSNNL